MLRELLRIVAWVTCSVLLVLLVPSSAWSASTDTPGSDASPSPSPASESVLPSSEPTSSESPSSPDSSPESSPSPEPGTASPTEDPAPAPEQGGTVPPEPTATVTETVTAEPQPVQAETMSAGTEEDPTVVTLDLETKSLLLLTSALVALGVGARVVGSFGGR